MDVKVIVSTKNGKSYGIDLPADKEPLLYHKKIGDDIEGDLIGLPGYVLKITGGSDISGFPMRYDIEGNRKIKIYTSKGPGYKPKRKGEFAKKTVRGNEIDNTITEVNTIVVKEGTVKIEEILGKKEGDKEGDKQNE
ncbi:30S ribosomal protein S6e [Candidatus Micrarchaeota archaeon]|nr:30S ribosomal protein S6e [Candidatus Micrarchaeota archaeon]